MPSIIPGVIASGKSGHLWSPSSSDYQSISTATVTSGGTASITFSSIPTTFTHLQIRMMGRIEYAATVDWVLIRLNSDSTSNYSTHYLYGDGSTPTATAATSVSYGLTGVLPGSSATASIFGVSVVDILDYGSTAKNKTIRALWGSDLNGSGRTGLQSSLYFTNTNAVSTITLTPSSAANFSEFSKFSLYGVK